MQIVYPIGIAFQKKTLIHKQFHKFARIFLFKNCVF